MTERTAMRISDHNPSPTPIVSTREQDEMIERGLHERIDRLEQLLVDGAATHDATKQAAEGLHGRLDGLETLLKSALDKIDGLKAKPELRREPPPKAEDEQS